MSKKKNTPKHKHDIGRGKIKDNYYAALVTSPMFKHKVEEPKKGKDKNYSRKVKHKKSLDDKFRDFFYASLRTFSTILYS